MPETADLDRLSAVEIRDVIVQTVQREIEACGALCDGVAARLTRSGKLDEALVAVALGAQIRARKPQ